jgi:hypothetical protein
MIAARWFMRPWSLLVSVVLFGCGAKPETAGPPTETETETETETDTDTGSEPGSDADGDGFSVSDGDCDDADGARYPGAADDVGDAVDQNCDGLDGVDQDGDGNASTESGGGDCVDTDPAVSPSATDLAGDGVDQNCDGTDGIDADGDGVASEVSGGADCDDGDPTVFPGADDVPYDGIDADCDGASDTDLDGDGHDGVEAGGPDCDDTDPGVSPSAAEVCGGGDEDCDGSVDEPDASDAGSWYADVDGDGFGDPDAGAISCVGPAGTVPDDSDCDDGDPSVNPDGVEVCGGLDEDCDGSIDEPDAEGAPLWYTDGDGDGFGDPAAATAACSAPAGTVDNALDCDDALDSVSPAASEVCGGGDEDCDGSVDEDGAGGAVTYYVDADGDGYGDAAAWVAACAVRPGLVADRNDCDDADPAINPAGTEACGGGDEDCDGASDEPGAAGALTWYLDADRDGYGTADRTTLACARPPGYAATFDDCGPLDAGIHPGASEACNGLDDDCDAVVPVDETVDGDRDGLLLCEDPDDTDPGCTFAEDAYVESVSFLDGLGSTAMGLAWDGAVYWGATGGSTSGVRLGPYSGSGPYVDGYAPGLDFRSLFTMGGATLFATTFDEPTLFRFDAPGVETAVFDFEYGLPNPQSGAVWQEATGEFVARSGSLVERWDIDGNYTAPVLLAGTSVAEAESPQAYRIAVADVCMFTYLDGVLSVWDTDGTRKDQAELVGAGDGWNSNWSLSYANGMVWVLDDATSLWRGYDVGL